MKNIFLLFTVLLTVNFCSTKSDPSKSFDGQYETIASAGSLQYKRMTSSDNVPGGIKFEIKNGNFSLKLKESFTIDGAYTQSLEQNIAVFKLSNQETVFTQMKLENNILYIGTAYDTQQKAASTTSTFNQFAKKL